jgi:hypothetical protein
MKLPDRQQCAFIAGVAFVSIFIGRMSVGDGQTDVIQREQPNVLAREERTMISNSTPLQAVPTAENRSDLKNQEFTIPPELAERIAKKHYVLLFEMPYARAALSNAVVRSAENYRETIISSEYKPLLINLNIDQAAKDKLMSHLQSIQAARVEAEQYLIQLDRAKEAFDKSARQLMSADQYVAYREAEAQRPAARELGRFKQYLEQEERVWLSPEDEQVLYAALRQAKTTPELDGPYGTGTRAFAGRE